MLFELLSRYSDSGSLQTIDQAEERVLWDLCALLERSLVAPLAPDYTEQLASARARLRDPE